MTVCRFAVLLTLPAAMTLAAACGGQNAPPREQQPAPAAPKGPTVTSERFGAMPDGSAVDVYTLKNAAGMEVKAISYGGIITSLKVPDRAGAFGDVVMGFDTL